METRTGQLFDLGIDGIGFIAEAGCDRIWAFQFPESGRELAKDASAFVRLEGETVRFSIDRNRVGSIVCVKATSHK